MSTVLVTGGTGTLGGHVVRELREAGHRVRVASRRQAPDGSQPSEPVEWATVDYRDGSGLDAALDGTDAVVHCATSVTGREARVAAPVLAAARRTGCPHVVYISIVGVDTLPLGYYRTKFETERLVAESGLPWTILRATQFHDLVARVLGALTRSPVVPIPAGVSVQPVHSGEVAARLARLALGAPSGRVPDFGGPEVRTLRDLAASYLSATGRRRAVLPVRLAGAAYRGYREGLHLAPGHLDGTLTFERFLAQR